MMGGGHHGMINLVSPADSPTQIRRGSVMIGSYAFGMMGQSSMVAAFLPAMMASATPRCLVRLRLTSLERADERGWGLPAINAERTTQ